MSKAWKKFVDDLPDPDDVFAYDTVKEVKVLDRRLGLIYNFVLISVIFYIVIWVFMIKKQYLDSEKSNGWLIARLVNPSHTDTDLPIDIFDAATNPGEQGALFVPTRMLITKGQAQEGFCESYTHPCKAADDCDIGNELLQKKECVNGFCNRRGWCPPEKIGAAQTTDHNIEAERFDIWFQTNVHYHKFKLDVSTTQEDEPVRYPAPRANTYPVHDLLRMANVRLEDVAKQGAVVMVNALFNCDLDMKKCETKVETANVDSVTGYNYVYNHYYYDGDTRKRISIRMFGIRFICFATGIGVKTSFAMIVLQVSSAIALLGVAQTVADGFLQYVVPERKHYVEQKVIPTEDFND